MSYKVIVNPFEGTLQLVNSSSGGGITGPPTSTDRAIVSWNGTTGEVVQDNPNTLIQAGGGLQAAALMEDRQITETINVPTNYTWVADSLEMQPGGVITMQPASKIVIN